MFNKKASKTAKALDTVADWVAPPKKSAKKARIVAALAAGVPAAILAGIFGVKKRDTP